MKNLYFILLVFFVISCGAGSISVEKIVGKWKITNYEGSEDSPLRNTRNYELSDCDKQSVWNFSNEDAEPLDDGTEVKKLVVTGPEDCQFADWDAKWTVIQDKLFMNTTRLGGIGGPNLAGAFDVNEFSGNKLVLEMFGCVYTLEKAE